MTPVDTRVVTAHIPVALAELIDQHANRLERSRGWIIKQALSAWVAQEQERHRLTCEALEDVDNGRVMTDQEIQSWADSLNLADREKAVR